MELGTSAHKGASRITLAKLSTPYKALVTSIIATLAFGMLGALGQVIVHDIIPTFFTATNQETVSQQADMTEETPQQSADDRGDLFTDLPATEVQKEQSFYQDEQFVWTLRWTHIHLFSMNIIFILLGVITALLDASNKVRTWLIVLPFIGVLVDILAMWLKGFVSPAFFWLHIPGGGVFAVIFGYVSIRAFWEMWLKPQPVGS
jgi:hypothetical protein